MISLPLEDVDWFEDAYGEGRLSWVLSLLLREFHKAHAIKPDDYAAIAAKVLQTKIESE